MLFLLRKGQTLLNGKRKLGFFFGLDRALSCVCRIVVGYLNTREITKAVGKVDLNLRRRVNHLHRFLAARPLRGHPPHTTHHHLRLHSHIQIRFPSLGPPTCYGPYLLQTDALLACCLATIGVHLQTGVAKRSDFCLTTSMMTSSEICQISSCVCQSSVSCPSGQEILASRTARGKTRYHLRISWFLLVQSVSLACSRSRGSC